jgi:hypothetical protein
MEQGDDGGGWEQQGRKGRANRREVVAQPEVEDLDRVRTAYRRQATEMAERYRSGQRSAMQNVDNYEQTQCIMFYRAGGNDVKFVAAFSGSAYGMREAIAANRRLAGVQDKEKVCAEERLLAQQPGQRFLFSFSFDGMGPKSACRDCKRILAALNIEDLVS